MLDINEESSLLDILNVHINKGKDIIDLYSNSNDVKNYEINLNKWRVEGIQILKKLNIAEKI